MVFEERENIHLQYNIMQENQCQYLNNFPHRKQLQSHTCKYTIHTAWSAFKLWRCRNTEYNFVSRTAGLRPQTSHTIGFEITTMWDFIHCNTTQKMEQHNKPQCPPPLL